MKPSASLSLAFKKGVGSSRSLLHNLSLLIIGSTLGSCTPESKAVTFDSPHQEAFQKIAHADQQLREVLGAVSDKVVQLEQKTLAVGDYKFSANECNHGGCLPCDGSAISRIDYAELLAVVLGEAFGEGDTTTTFNLPDPRGRVAGMSGQGDGLNTRTTAQQIGEETHKLTVNKVPRHDHTGFKDSSFFLAGGTFPHESTVLQASDYTYAEGIGRSPLTSVEGSNQPHNNSLPTLFVVGNLFIYASE